MAKTTDIQWTDSTFNAWIGCTQISPACDNCYAKAQFNDWLKQVKWGVGQPRKRTSEANWKQPIKWNKEAQETGIRRKVFCNSLSIFLV